MTNPFANIYDDLKTLPKEPEVATPIAREAIRRQRNESRQQKREGGIKRQIAVLTRRVEALEAIVTWPCVTREMKGGKV